MNERWYQVAIALLAPPADPGVAAEAHLRAGELAALVVQLCSELREPFQHVVPLIAAARILADLAMLCGDEPDFITAAADVARRLRETGSFTFQEISGSSPS